MTATMTPTRPKYDRTLAKFARQVRSGSAAGHSGPMRLGVDLGTANIVLAVVDEANRPVTGAWVHSTVVRDGIVVDWVGAVRAVRDLRAVVEDRLRKTFKRASVAIPPGISPGTVKVFSNVIEAAGLDLDEVVDEPVAAARVLGVRDGCVIDIGHGTTGVSVLRHGRVELSTDEPTGGHHMTLILSGANGIGYQEAEAMKKDPAAQEYVFGAIRPTLEKMAGIAAAALRGHEVDDIFLVGGSSSFARAAEVFETVLGQQVRRPEEPLFATPLGIPMRQEET